MKADFITVLLNRPHAAPAFDIYSQLVYALKASDVTDVAVNGRVLVENGRLLSLPKTRVVQEARAYIERIRASVSKAR
jgi:5-methylthioadenosine/S-adenosylhomocysteine deaminase